ncbi:flavin reductase family protein [Alteromonas lipolytica]|uniref:Flavin oxidoreductase n=1 Tax=Alteromonas lipolytica TaxID=1856405 RepID=A0A1E8FJC2_9ALTE|nr:flavin reductase [Alteromonas lipolytica]OFI35533.1 flavin oxidoreductase [Alteromonas lipolytica]GGF77014.1 flavin oxidoreductase [Alteromonas lipolytica]
MDLIDSAAIEAMEQRYRANFINSLSGYKSANLIGTCNQQQQTNLAIVSSVVHIGASPPLMGMIMRPHSVVRDTLGNIKQTGFYTINAMPVSMYAQGHQTSARYPSAISEFDACDFTTQWQPDFAAPFVAESPLKIGLQLAEIIPIALNNTELVIGHIQQVMVNPDAITDDGNVDISALQLAAISGLDTYHQVSPIAKMAYAKPDIAPAALKIFNADQ